MRRDGYEGGMIPPDWDRRDPIGDLIDPATGGRIREMDVAGGGWVNLGEGMAMRFDEFMTMTQPPSYQSPASQPWQQVDEDQGEDDEEDDSSAINLLLLL
ncbi:hypothetical protein ACI797_19105 [Geodermatophilus sp. SYSU D00691]